MPKKTRKKKITPTREISFVQFPRTPKGTLTINVGPHTPGFFRLKIFMSGGT